MKKNKRLFVYAFLFFVIGSQPFIFAQEPKSPLLDSWQQYLEMREKSEFDLEWISLGPVLNSARVEAIQCDPTHPGTMYVAFGSGNLWKTTNHGLSWRPIFEDQSALGIGDIALAPSNPDILWLGSGESLKKPRNFTMPGTGIFRSDDGGETWKNTGLHDSYHIGEIAVHPQNPNIVFVAVQGHFWSTNVNRGIYRTINGGKTWEHVLFINERTGGNDIVLSPANPDILYASMWENYPATSGEHSGVYRSNDGGETWQRLTNGFPAGPKTGRIGLAVSWTNPDKVYALVDNLNKKNKLYAEVYKSTTGGQTWDRSHEEELHIFSRIGWYFTDCYVNPMDDEEIFVLGVRMARSSDGGKTFELVAGDVFHFFPSPTKVLHLDHCELWINPENPDHLALGNDGGLYVSYDKGKTWKHYNNIPAGEFYDISVDNQDPYHVYGGTQDNASVFGPAQEWDAKFQDTWQYIWFDIWSGGDGCYTMADPLNPDVVYSSSQHGGIFRKNLKTGAEIRIRPKLPKGHEGQLNYHFVAPYIISRHNPLTLYHAGNYVFKSLNRGDSWQLISPDLSQSAHKEKKSIASGAIAESPLEPGLLFVGTDKGAFWVRRDDGKNWQEHSAGLANGYIRSICPSRFDKGRVYVAVTGINYDDLKNHLYVSNDYGKTWRSIVANLPDEVAYVILEDPVNEDILYAGLYRGVYITVDRGKTWFLLDPQLPAMAIADLVIQEREMDLLAGTHGRGIYKMNIRPIQEAYTNGFPKKHRLFDPPVARLLKGKPVEKIPITFYLLQHTDVELQVINDKGQTVWNTSVKGKKGFNQMRWDLVIKRNHSPKPYFFNYLEFLPQGTYELHLVGTGLDLKTTLIVRAI